MFSLSREETSACIRNSLFHIEEEEGFISYLRFTPGQLAVYENDPLYRLMSLCPAGICLELETNGDEISFECRTADFSPKTLVEIKGEMTLGQVMQLLGEKLKKLTQAGRLDVLQHFDLYIDDVYSAALRLSKGKITFRLPNPDLEWIRVRVFFPLYKPIYINNVCGSGEWRPVQQKRPLLYAFGDSITQGFISGKPSLCYVSQLAGLLGADALNQGIGGAMFDPNILTGFEKLPVPDLVTVAYGTNDWYNGLSLGDVSKKTKAFFQRLHKLFADTPVFVITPIWRDDADAETGTGSFSGVIRMIGDIAGKYANMHLVDGLAISPHNPACYSDGYLHPNTAGFSYMAPRIYKEICTVLKKTQL